MPRDHTHTVHEDPTLTGLARLVTEGKRAAKAASIAASVGRDGDRTSGVGASGLLDDHTPVTAETVFDLASVTKPFTALAAARLARRGVFSLATPLGALVAEARGTSSEDVPLELLLAHRGGLAAHLPLFAPLLEGRPVDRSAALRVAASSRRPELTTPLSDQGFPPTYSDVGYLLVGEALERATGRSLMDVLRAEVADPIGAAVMSGRSLREAGLLASVAPTEDVPFRDGVIRGLVHDENAWALGGDGVCGHAGLFGDSRSVLALGVALLETLSGRRDDWLTAAQLEPLLRERPGGTLRAGFDGKTPVGSSSGARFGPRTFGHLGFTGTSLWVDPDAALVGVLLTNRVHPTRASDAIREARPAVYDGIFDWAQGKRAPLRGQR